MNGSGTTPLVQEMLHGDGTLRAPKSVADPQAPGQRGWSDRMRKKTGLRLVCLLLSLGLAFVLLGGRLAMLASTGPEPTETRLGESIEDSRAEIHDRNGHLLAGNLLTSSLYAHPREMIEPERAAQALARIIPELDEGRLLRDFTSARKFVWVRRTISPEQRQKVHDIGEPGLQFGRRYTRVYPNGHLAAHVLGGVQFGKEGVWAAELVGVAGAERFFDRSLRNPERREGPLVLSIDSAVQATTRRVLAAGLKLVNARGGSAVLMDAFTGELFSLVSLPDFDPNRRPIPAAKSDPSESPIFNRTVQGVYELGSALKVLTAAVAVDAGLVSADTIINTTGPLVSHGFRIRDYRDNGPELSVRDVIVKSSNVGVARMALEFGASVQKDFLKRVGFFEPVPVELHEASNARPLIPDRWTDLTTITVSYGHGIAISPLHLASAYATVVNGGTRVVPSILRGGSPTGGGERVISQASSVVLRNILRAVVEEGTASIGDIPGYAVGGKTGTAEKPKPTGGYYEDRVIATFASVFPSTDPRYVLVVTLDEPEIEAHGKTWRTAGWTAVPVAGEIIARVAPILGLRPVAESETPASAVAERAGP